MNRALTPGASVGAMGNVLDPSKQQQAVALGRLGWSRCAASSRPRALRRETVGDYLRAAGVPVRGRGRPRADAPAAPSEATAKPAISSPGCPPTARCHVRRVRVPVRPTVT